MQLVFYWAPKLARKCESKHWFPCGADGRSYGHVITKFSRMSDYHISLAMGLRPPARFARGWSSAIITCDVCMHKYGVIFSVDYQKESMGVSGKLFLND